MMQGTRVYPDGEGWLYSSDIDAPGSFGRSTAREVSDSPLGWWRVTAPDGSKGSLNPALHSVTEHGDGTITVTPSIVTATWHGWLKAGVWGNA